jgi:hypothetical protein
MHSQQKGGRAVSAREEGVWAKDLLMEAADYAFTRGENLLAQARSRAVPELDRSTAPVVLYGAEAVSALNRYLLHLERELEGLCAPHDFRALLLTSRACVGVEHFRTDDDAQDAPLKRCQTADYAVLKYGRRDLTEDIVRDQAGNYVLPASDDISNDIYADVVALHFLAPHYRDVAWCLPAFAFLSEFRREMNRERSRKLPPARLEISGGTGVQFSKGEAALAFGADLAIVATEEAIAAQKIFTDQFNRALNHPVAAWGWMGPKQNVTTRPATLWMPHADADGIASTDGTVLFQEQSRGLGSLHDLGRRFRKLWDECIGIPPAHLTSILSSLGRIAWNTAPHNPFYFTTGTMFISREDVVGGKVLETASRSLAEYYPDVRETVTLEQSLARFVSVASSSGKQDLMNLRTIHPSFIIHGEPHQSTWALDFNATMLFIQHVYDLLALTEVSRSATSAEDAGTLGSHDADVRTSLFDVEVADYLRQAEGVELAFQEHRKSQDVLVGLPRFHPPVSGRGDDIEIDVPLRVGSVFIPVQTRTSVVRLSYMEGNLDIWHRRWESIKKKRRDTDKQYATKLATDAASREFLLSNGIKYILPILCIPYPEPVCTTRRAYWLRSPADEHRHAVFQGRTRAVQRILAPDELHSFLNGTDETELRRIARRVGRAL